MDKHEVWREGRLLIEYEDWFDWDIYMTFEFKYWEEDVDIEQDVVDVVDIAILKMLFRE